jgi:hypothetical protein
VVTNTGNVSIKEDKLHDDVLGDIPGTHVLAPGQSFTETLLQTATVPIKNTATITATYSATGVITAEDSAVVTIAAPAPTLSASGLAALFGLLLAAGALYAGRRAARTSRNN